VASVDDNLAVKYGVLDSVRELVEHGADFKLVLVQVESVDDNLVSVLHMAVKYGVLDSVRELIEHGADKDRYNLQTFFFESTPYIFEKQISMAFLCLYLIAKKFLPLCRHHINVFIYSAFL
jgi:ankyrin repeat protein